MGKLIILRGNSGSGKTTVAKELQKKFGYNTMLISQDEIRRNILWVKDGIDTKALPLMIELLSDDEDMSVVEEESYAYYRRALETGEHIAYLVYDNGKFIGAGGVSFYQVMPTYHNPTGKKAYIMNMYTAPEYRRQGIAIHTLDLLVKDAKEQGVLQIALEATDMGRPLYERYGFVKMEDEMELI